ncbi:GlsB/YeaQ/YmgE family stress response membrane protein [Fodinibius sp. SL11]|uniref:GlsB/YeaQ/YmgE family stress response membrane protein n=1 Tax=Fodinibius sp. SL11 TaxID=3425690 RepID=UPI003F882378
MEELNGTMIFWLISIGMVAGALIKVSIWKQGVELIPNLIAGVIGAVVVGSIAIFINLPGSLVFGFLGSLVVLFILNVFYLQSDEDHA